MRVLLVEDEESLRITLAANLEVEDHEVVEACNGEEAIALLEEHEFDLVFSDIRMPKKGGVDLLQHVKQHHPDLPVVLMTAYAHEQQIDTAITEGVFAVLRKPFDFDKAVVALTTAAERHAVLVVDDDHADASTLTESLVLSGVHAKACFSGEDAVRSLSDGKFDVCVTDLVMPGTSGAEVVARTKELESRVSVIVCSGANVPEMLQKVSSLGVFACMRKPLSPGDVMRTIVKARGGECAL